MLSRFALVCFAGWFALPVVLGGNWGPAWSDDLDWSSLSRFYRELWRDHTHTVSTEAAHVVHEWIRAEYDWPCDYVEHFYRDCGLYRPNTNSIGGIDVYKGDVYVTVYRSSWGVPSGLNKVVTEHGKSLLQPFPSLIMNELGRCSNLQYPVSTTTDPMTGYMYVLDVGNTQTISKTGVIMTAYSSCPAKIVVLDLNRHGAVVYSYDLPESVVPRNLSSVNDLVLDKVSRDGKTVRYAYITDPGLGQIITFDFSTRATWAFSHHSMLVDENRHATIEGVTVDIFVSVNGIAMDADFEYVYYSAVGSYRLSQIPTFVLRNPHGAFASHHRFVGKKVSQSDSLFMGQKSLFYGAQELNAVYKWEITKDMADHRVTKGHVTLRTQTEVARDDHRMIWVDDMKIDEHGYLWFTTNKDHRFLRGESLDMSDSADANFRIWRVYVGEKSYLWREPKCTGIFC